MSEQTYNGWANYPTWVVNLWLSNDQGLAYETENVTREAIEDADGHADDAHYDVEKGLKSFVEGLSEEHIPSASFITDLCGWALAHVDWSEIASAWIENVQEADEYV